MAEPLSDFSAAEYEDELDSNSTWATGDWNCNGEFETGDLIEAFRAGAYDAAAKQEGLAGRNHFDLIRSALDHDGLSRKNRTRR